MASRSLMSKRPKLGCRLRSVEERLSCVSISLLGVWFEESIRSGSGGEESSGYFSGCGLGSRFG